MTSSCMAWPTRDVKLEGGGAHLKKLVTGFFLPPRQCNSRTLLSTPLFLFPQRSAGNGGKGVSGAALLTGLSHAIQWVGGGAL